MKNKEGFSKVGIIACIAGLALIIITTVLVIQANSNIVNYANYDFFSIIEADKYNGSIADHVKGDPNAPVLIFEYADYQCPGCASMNNRVNEAIKSADGKLAVVYRNYLLSYHKNGTAAASAAEAAGIQGYWKEYADKLFSEQAEWEYSTSSERTALFENYFLKVTNGEGDLNKFRSDLASNEVSQKISFDMGIGKRLVIPGTPAFYVDGQIIEWNNKEGGSVIVNNKELTWDHSLSGSEFVDLILKIVEIKTSN